MDTVQQLDSKLCSTKSTPKVDFVDRDDFVVLTEVSPPKTPSMSYFQSQIEMLAPYSDAFLVPDNHLGLITPGSVPIACQLATNATSPVFPCLNARDRNLLRLQSDLFTAAMFEIKHVLLVNGEDVEGAARTDLTASTMLRTTREMCQAHGHALPGFRAGAVIEAGRPIGWRSDADFLLVQVSHDLGAVAAWRETLEFDGKVYVGVLVLASAEMAVRLNSKATGISTPDHVIEMLQRDPSVGVNIAMEQLATIEQFGIFDGVHLVPVSKYQRIAALLSSRERTRTPAA